MEAPREAADPEGAAGAKRIILRARLSYRDTLTMAHSLAITAQELLVHTDEPARLGDTMRVELSFPGLLAPFSFHTRVNHRRTASGVGDARGWWLAFDCRTAAEQAQLDSLFARLTPRGSATAPNAPYRVLVVDDSELTRAVFAERGERHFRDRAPTVVFDLASDTRDAWSLVLRGNHDLVLVDYFLPRLYGDRLIMRLRNHGRLERIPIVAMSTGHSRARDATISAGADLFLPKPVVVSDLIATLETLATTQGTT